MDLRNTLAMTLLINALLTRKLIEQVPIQVRDRTDKSRYGSSFSGNTKFAYSIIRLMYWSIITALKSKL